MLSLKRAKQVVCRVALAAVLVASALTAADLRLTPDERNDLTELFA